jgi:hypothetical protein
VPEPICTFDNPAAKTASDTGTSRRSGEKVVDHHLAAVLGRHTLVEDVEGHRQVRMRCGHHPEAATPRSG